MSEDPYKLFKSQASGYDVPPQTSSPTYDQSAFNQSNELYQPFESSEDFQNPVGFMGSAPLAQLNPALGGCSAAYGGYGNGNNNPGANYGHPGLTDTTLQPTRNMQDYSAGLTHAPVPAGEFAFADPSQNFMQYTGRGAAGLGSGTASQAPFDYDWSDYTAPNAEYL
ncbi:uncharacterized protein BDV14DRAFT_194845 [Aspergillus stella-maris]|uniref:uncharacterized protein n=1 Tax=Aspergillus stella-maris TaxID=1810926 RepID=UPI003CCDF719